jgi:pimeloyl-ACP methyl ester carboxylesterase
VRLRARNVVIGVAALGAVAALGLVGYAATAEWLFFRRHPPPGRLLDVGGHRLHIGCSGAGAPAVIFESSLGGSSVDWYAVQPEVSRFTRACAYDRAGAGWSDAAPLPRDPSRTAEELHTLLGKAGVMPPYVLVGHSYGGYVVRVFAHRFRSEMAGLVLVDIATPEMWQRAPSVESQMAQMARDCRWDKLRAVFAISRLRGDSMTYVPPALRPIADGFFLSRKFQDDSCGEVQAMLGEGQAQVRQAGSFGALPLAIVTAGQRGTLDEESWRVWQEIQRGLPALSTRSTQSFATQSSHHVQFGEPQAVVTAVRGVVGEARRSLAEPPP